MTMQNHKQVGSKPTLRTTEDSYALGKILSVLVSLKQQGYADATLKPMDRRLRLLKRHVDLDSPEQVKKFISEQGWSQGFKGNVVTAYDHYVQYHGLTWKKPFYERVDRIHRVPNTEDINRVIAHASFKYAVCFCVLRDTGVRPVEASQVQVKDLDLEKGLLYPKSAKHGRGRVLKLKPSTVAMLKRFISQYDLTAGSSLLWPSLRGIKEAWIRTRNNVAEKLSLPQMRQIRLYDLRHHFATLLYIRTKDIVHVKRQLGHRNIQSTLRYIGAVDFDKQEFIVKVAASIKETTELVSQGFEFVTAVEDQLVFRKPKLPSFFSVFHYTH